MSQTQDIQVNYGCRYCHEGAVETVQHASMSRQDVSGVFDSQGALEKRFGQVSLCAEDHDGQSQPYPFVYI